MGQLTLALDPLDRVPYCFDRVPPQFWDSRAERSGYIAGLVDAHLEAESRKIRPAEEVWREWDDLRPEDLAYRAAWDEYRARHPEVAA